MTGGLALVTLSMLGIANLAIDMPLWFVLAIFFVFGFGMGNVIAPASTVMQNALPLARAGAGSAVQNTVRQVFGALGVAVMATVLATQYASNVAPVLGSLPAGTPDDVRELATNSVGGTVAVLNQLGTNGAPAELVAQGKQVAYTSFLDAAHVTSLMSMVLVLVAALVVWFMLPPITPPQRGAHGAPGGSETSPTDQTPEDEHGAFGDARTRAEANAEAEHIEEAYATEAAEEYGSASVGEPERS